jgi:KDO2-lipid IV(A) lauroyltransferase
MSRLKDLLSAQLYLVGWKIVQALPEKSAYRLFEKLGKTLYNRDGKAVQRLRLNLGVVSPGSSAVELEVLVVKGISSYFRYWCDTFRFPGWSVEKIRNTVKVTNEHLLKDPVAAGTGVIVALPHSGNWDHAGAYFCAQGIPLVSVAERLKPEKLFQKFLTYRRAIGMEILPLDGNTLPTLSNRLNEGKLIALVADRDFSKSGVEVDFFSKKAKMPIGPAVLSLRTGAPLITAQVSYNPNGIQIDFLGPLTPRIEGSLEERAKDLVQQCADNFETGISKHPEDWHMLQRIWIEPEVSNG